MYELLNGYRFRILKNFEKHKLHETKYICPVRHLKSKFWQLGHNITKVGHLLPQNLKNKLILGNNKHHVKKKNKKKLTLPLLSSSQTSFIFCSIYLLSLDILWRRYKVLWLCLLFFSSFFILFLVSPPRKI